MSYPPYVPCGFEASCGRALGHQGHHGGWRTGIAGTSGSLPKDGHTPSDRLGCEITPRQLQVLAESLIHGDCAAAARCMGISTQTAKNHLTALLARTGANSSRQAAVVLGWVVFPQGVTGHTRAVA